MIARSKMQGKPVPAFLIRHHRLTAPFAVHPGDAGDVDRLSLHALFPRLAEAERKAAVRRAGKRLPGAGVLDTDFPADSKFDHLPAPQGVRAGSAFLSIQEGCDKFCTFCVVPYTRGAEYSRPVDAVLAEATSEALGGVSGA